MGQDAVGQLLAEVLELADDHLPVGSGTLVHADEGGAVVHAVLP
jgi:hypothetical protein